MCHSFWKNSSCKALKAKSILHGTTGQRFGGLMLQSLNVMQHFYIFRCVTLSRGNWFPRIFMAHEINVYGFMAQYATWKWYIQDPWNRNYHFSFFTTPEISECNFHGPWYLQHTNFSWLMNPSARYFMQFHEPWKPLSTFHRKFMAWKIGHENEISVFRALKNAFLGLQWHFHGIFITLQFIVFACG